MWRAVARREVREISRARWLEMHGLTELSGEAYCAAMMQSVDMYLEMNKVEMNKGKLINK